LNAELVACRTSTPWKSRQHKRRFGRFAAVRSAANASAQNYEARRDRGEYRQAAELLGRDNP
jgi:hypothetical protein